MTENKLTLDEINSFSLVFDIRVWMILTDPYHGFYWFDGCQARARTSIAYRKLKRGRQNISIFISGQFDRFYKIKV